MWVERIANNTLRSLFGGVSEPGFGGSAHSIGHGAGGHFVLLILLEPTKIKPVVFECISCRGLEVRGRQSVIC